MSSSIAVATATAERVLARVQRSGPKASMAPTPERLLKAAGLAHLRFATDAEGSAAVQVPQVVVTAAPLDVMAKRRRLDPDPARAAAMLSAGRRYLALWTRAGLSPLKGQDPGAIRTTATGAGFVGTAAKQEAWDDYVAASNAMRPDTRRAVDAIVLHEMSLLDAGAKADPMTTDRASRITLGSYELKRGLRDLAVHFGLMDLDVLPAEVAAPASLPPEMAALLGAIDAREARVA